MASSDPSTPTSVPADPSQRGGGELSKQYRPAEHEARIFNRWEEARAFHADPSRVLRGEAEPYCVLIPPPNVTDRLHLGHALNNSLQDILVRAHRMMGYETLWMPGTDHAGIATQAVVEKRLRKDGILKGPLKSSMQREEFVAHVQAFKDEYEAVITGQLKAMGCSCDWARQRFTMDPVCARAVREAFFRLFKDGLIYRGKRLVNWDPALQTAVADDEVENIEVDGSFYYLRYPLVHRGAHTSTSAHQHTSTSEEDAVPVTWDELTRRGYPGAGPHDPEEQAWVTVATTRPETYLGDTAVAVSPKDPRAKALRGLFVELPIVGRVIPVIEDEYVVLPSREGAYGKLLNLPQSDEPEDAKAAFATGFLKVTPAHDPNDYELGQRHKLPMINVMAPDASISDKHGWSDPHETAAAHIFIGKKREEARKLVVKEFEARGLLEDQKPYRHSVGHSDRSKAAIEPYLSDQWYVRVTDPRMAASANAALNPAQRTHSREGAAPAMASSGAAPPQPRGGEAGMHAAGRPRDGGEAGMHAAGRPRDGGEAGVHAAGLPRDGRQAGMSPTGAQELPGPHGGSAGAEVIGDGALSFHPARYAKTYESWHDNIRDWCISRQLWWGHRIPVWTKRINVVAQQLTLRDEVLPFLSHFDLAYGEHSDERNEKIVAWWIYSPSTGAMLSVRDFQAQQSLRSEMDGEYILYVVCKVARDEVCPETDGFNPVEHLEENGFTQDPDVLDTWFSSALWPVSTMGWPEETDLLRAFNPSSTLCTAREIITLWVSRMVMFNRYLRPGEKQGPPPEALASTDLEGSYPRPGRPERTLSEPPSGYGAGPVPFRDVYIHCVVQDGQGRKMSKSLGNGVDPLDIIASHGTDAMRFTICHMATQTQDVRLPVKKDAATGKNTSDKFDLGRNFANKLWNAASFALRNLGGGGTPSLSEASSEGSDRGRETTRGASDPRLRAQSPSVSASQSLPDRWMLSRLAVAVGEVEAALANFEFSSYAQIVYDLLWRDFCDWYLEAIKPTVAEDASQRAVLAATLDTILRLLHPIMPYVTEAIYEQVRTIDAGAVAGVTLGGARKGGLLATAAWPKVDASLRDAAAEAEFEQLRALITAVREVRAKHNVHPRRRPTLHAPTSELANLRVHETLVSTLAGLGAITDKAPAAGMAFVDFTCEGAEYKLSDLADAGVGVDAGAEKARLTKLVADLEKSVTTFEARLANPGYALKAPPAMVQQTKDQMEKAKAELAAARKALEALGGLG